MVSGEGGLLGLAVDPEFTTNHFVYALRHHDRRPARFTVSRHAGALQHDSDIVTGMPVNPSGVTPVPTAVPPGSSPPQLVIGTGDAHDGTIAQNLQSLGGKVLAWIAGAPCPGNPASATRRSTTASSPGAI